LLPTYQSELFAGQNCTKISTGFSYSRSLDFQMKKLLDDGVDLPLRQREEKSFPSRMSSRSCRFCLPTASLCWRMGQCRRLTRAFEIVCGALGPKDAS
jgi:hypothetical protein